MVETIDLRTQWKTEFLHICMHERPVPIFKSGVVLANYMVPCLEIQIWPPPTRSRGAGGGGRGGRGRGRRGRGGRGPAVRGRVGRGRAGRGRVGPRLPGALPIEDVGHGSGDEGSEDECSVDEGIGEHDGDSDCEGSGSSSSSHEDSWRP